VTVTAILNRGQHNTRSKFTCLSGNVQIRAESPIGHATLRLAFFEQLFALLFARTSVERFGSKLAFKAEDGPATQL
jgi:hypothetical protein